MLSFETKARPMIRTVLRFEYDYDFYLLGLVSPLKDYRLCWALNKDCNMNFVKRPDLEIHSNQRKKLFYFSIFEYADEARQARYNIISNKRNGECLIPEMKEADYFFMMRGTDSGAESAELVDLIRSNPHIQTVFEVDPQKLKSRQNLILE